MLTEPRDLDREAIRSFLEGHWGLRNPQLQYLPVGFGSHHWRAIDSRDERRFVTVDDLRAGFQAGPDEDAAFASLDRAFRIAATLRDKAALEFVLAPILDREGRVIRRVSERYAVTVFPLIEGGAAAWGPYKSAAERRDIGGILGRLHAVTGQVPAGLPRREEFRVPARAALLDAIDDLDRSWSTGPFAESTRYLLRKHLDGIHRRLEEYDRLVTVVRERSEPWVVTHGEPHRANVVRDTRGRVYLVDWDTTLLAPKERDLRHVLDRDDIGRTGFEEYLKAAGPADLNGDAMELYRRWWDLAEICVYTALFREPHETSDDSAKSFKELNGTLSGHDNA